MFLSGVGKGGVVCVCLNNQMNEVGFPKFIHVLLRRSFQDYLAGTVEVRKCVYVFSCRAV